MDGQPFTLFGLSHFVAIAATAAAAVFMVRLTRSQTVSARTRDAAIRTLAVMLVAGVVMDPLCTWLRYRNGPDDVWELIRENSLPLHLCDVVSCILAWTLVRPSQRCAELGYLWGLSGTLQGLITPALKHDWDSLEYYGFFGQHGGVIVAALTLAFGAGLAPRPGAVRRTMLWSWAYMAVVAGLNALLQTNYGYFNAKPDVASLLDYLGPWPWYLLSLQVVAVIHYSVLLLPFVLRNSWN